MSNFVEVDVPARCPCCSQDGLLPLIWPEGKHIDVETGIWPIREWGLSSGRGFVRDARFGSGQVIKGTRREVTRKWRRLQSNSEMR